MVMRNSLNSDWHILLAHGPSAANAVKLDLRLGIMAATVRTSHMHVCLGQARDLLAPADVLAWRRLEWDVLQSRDHHKLRDHRDCDGCRKCRNPADTRSRTATVNHLVAIRVAVAAPEEGPQRGQLLASLPTAEVASVPTVGCPWPEGWRGGPLKWGLLCLP